MNARIPTFCVVLPMYNERPNVAPCVQRLSAFLQGVPARTAIVAVDDGSTDGTLGELRRIESQIPNLIVEARPQNGGYGAANRTGFAAAVREGFEYALVMDADGTQDPAYIQGFIAPMQAGKDFIKATRYALGGRVLGVDWRRYMVSWIGNRLARIALRCELTDYTNGFRAIRSPLLARLDTRETNFVVLLEEIRLARKLGATFAEAPYTLTVRDDGASSSKFSYSWRVYLRYLKYLFDR
jgi:glycosyltransferase involved in cell wall biosynthesis